MRFQFFLVLALAGMLSACSFGTYPGSYPSGGQQSPDDTYGNNGNQPGSGRSADPGVTVNSIRLTREYTILNLTFTNKNRPHYDQLGQPDSFEFIEFDPAGQLVAANGARTFKFLRAEGIPLKAEKANKDANGRKLLSGIKTIPGNQVTFYALFRAAGQRTGKLRPV